MIVFRLFILFIVFIQLSGFSQVNQLIIQLENKNEDTSKINLLNKIADASYYTNPDDINKYANLALNLSEKLNYQWGKAQALNNLGIFFRAKGLYSFSIDYHFNSLKIMESLNDTSGMARCYNLIGILYYNLKNYDSAEEYFLKALALNKIQGDAKWIAGNTNNLGMIFEKREEYPEALKFYIEALEANILMNNQNWISNNYGNIGRLYLTLKNYSLAKEYLDKRLQINIDQNDLHGMAITYLLLGKYYYEQQDYQNASIQLLKGYQFADSIGSVQQLNNSTEELSRVYYKLGDFENAYRYNKLNKFYNDSLNLQDNRDKITRLQLQYDFRKSQQLDEFEFDKSWYLYLIFVLSLLLIILLAVYMYFRQRSITQQQILKEKNLGLDNIKLMGDIAFKEKQLEDNIKFLIHKNDFITNVIENLISLKSKIKSENISFIDEIIADLKSGVTDHIWKDFEYRFKEIHNDFYNNLNSLFPNLTANEKKLCAFLKLDMTTKEISAISKQSVKSIEAARTRLRKKLNLTESDINLSEFLSKF
jgi:tetratricopeptide (TPR) repeat protein